MARTLHLKSFARERERLTYTAEIAGRAFTSSFRYESVDFHQLEERHGGEALRPLYFHAVAFDLNRLVSLEPDRVDFGPFADQVTEVFLNLWQRVFEGVWAQWRYENDLPDYRGPEPAHPLAIRAPEPLPLEPSTSGPRSLLFCGGGKDSLLAAKLCEVIDEPYDSLAYSHSIYGDAELQHHLIDGLLDHCAPRQRHRMWIEDNFLGVVEPRELGVRTITAAETPSALFLSLPIALAHGLGHLIVAHERSADHGNLVWDKTGEEINHQWGKSLEAEALLDDYVGKQLLPGLRYFSLLKPVHDAVIFSALADYPEAIPATHSCNVKKPWCRRCAKCCYVFLGYAAWLPREVVTETFGENLFDVEENLAILEQLLGFGEHLPFECVGQVEESRAALLLAVRRGWSGRAVARLQQPAARDFDSVSSALECSWAAQRFPPALATRCLPALKKIAASTSARKKKEGGPRPSLTR